MLLEDQNSLTEPFFQNDIKAELKKIKSKMPNLVIISSCTSENIGDVFLEFVGHVISIWDTFNVLDSAAIRFTQLFYENIFAKWQTICVAFKHAKQIIKTEFSKNESKKFIIKRKPKSIDEDYF